MKWFDYAAPGSLGEALRLLAAHGNARPMAGGTDLIVQMRAGRRTPDLVIDIKKIPELNVLSFDPGKGLTMGAAVPCYKVYHDTAVRKAYPSLADVTSIIGGTQIQGRASVGGNLCNASPSADSIPLLIALGARCRIASVRGERIVPVEQFCTAPGKNVLEKDEILVSLQIPAPADRSGAKYLRFIPRNEMDIAVVGAGVNITLSNGHIGAARVALSAVAPIPLFVKEAGDWLVGKAPTEDNLRQAAEMAKAAATPITDMRGTAEYRKHLCAVLTRRALTGALEEANHA
ncbi:MAG: xanthine dehydrogenase family protein subunit M [Bryobacterales bacterium]|nr:xanthine dehydrogenase family protein subunit M [Bryobacterales bacterium]